MRVLFACRPDYLTRWGGDTTQILKTKTHLEKLGVTIDLVTSNNFDVSTYDLVHLFNITRVHDTFLKMRNAKSQNIPVALSTVYWDMTEYLQYGKYPLWVRVLNRLFLGSRLLDVGRWLAESLNYRRRQLGYGAGIRGVYFEQLMVLRWADILLPNGYAEQKKIEQNFQVFDTFQIVTNGVDHFDFPPNPRVFTDKFELQEKSFVLFVGSVGDRKNVLKLIQATNRLRIPLAIIGTGNKRSRYYELCQEAASPSTLFLGSMLFDEIKHAYAAAKAHALPSWYETPGLASLEAALAKCNIVSTDRGTTKEYFQDWAWYCDPRELDSICEAVESAFAAPQSDALSELVQQNYTWQKAAEQTLAAYNRILDQRLQRENKMEDENRKQAVVHLC